MLPLLPAVVAILVTVALALAATLARALTPAAGIVAAVFGAVIVVAAGYAFLALLILFVVASVLATRYRFSEKKARQVQEGKSGERGVSNVIAHILIPTGLALAVVHNPPLVPVPAIAVLYASALAFGAADTFGSEFGVLAGKARSILTLRPVTPGTNGGVSSDGPTLGGDRCRDDRDRGVGPLPSVRYPRTSRCHPRGSRRGFGISRLPGGFHPRGDARESTLPNKRLHQLPRDALLGGHRRRPACGVGVGPVSTRARAKGSVVLLSGGMDSATCLAVAARDEAPVHALTVLYGQRHAREVSSARALARYFHVARHTVLRLPLGPLLDSTLTRRTGPYPGPPADPPPSRPPMSPLGTRSCSL